MDETLFHKFTQHADLQADLLGTGDAELIEVGSPNYHCLGRGIRQSIPNAKLTPHIQDSDKDAFWGVGADRKGRNELGKCLERLRTKLRGLNQ